MTDLRDAANVTAMDIWQQAKEAYSVEPLVIRGVQLPSSKDEAAAAIIEADRAAVDAAARADERAKVVGEIVAWLRERGDVGFLSASYAIEAGEWDKTGVQP